MSDLNSTLVSILLIAGVALIGAIIYVLLRIVGTIRMLETEITTLTRTATPLLQKAEELTERANETFAMFQEHRDSLAVSVDNIRKVTTNIYRLERIVQDQLEPSFIGLASVLGGARRSITAFIENWRRGK